MQTANLGSASQLISISTGLSEVVEVHRFTPTERQTPQTNFEKLVLEHKLGEKTSQCLYWKPYPEAAAAFKLQQGASTTGQGRSWHSAPPHLLCLPTLQCSAPSQPFHPAHPLVATTQAELHSLGWLPQLHGEPSPFWDMIQPSSLLGVWGVLSLDTLRGGKLGGLGLSLGMAGEKGGEGPSYCCLLEELEHAQKQ